MLRKNLKIILFGVILSLGLVGCSTGQESTNENPDDTSVASEESAEKEDDKSNTSSESSGEEKVAQIGLITSYVPFAYIDENGDSQGYEYEVYKAIDEKLEDYVFEYSHYDFQSLFAALDSGQADSVSCQLNKTPEREEKYIFTNEPISVQDIYIVTLEESQYNPSKFEELAGKTVGVNSGTEEHQNLQGFADENPELEINVVPYENVDLTLENLQNGTYDAYITSEFGAAQHQKTRDIKLKLGEEPAYSIPAYFLLSKENEELRDAMDEALRELKEEGTLDQLYQDLVINSELLTE